MIHLLKTLLVFVLISGTTIIDFNKKTDLSNWYILDDVVMGGRSDGNFIINEDGNGLFYGKVSTKNNGGFSSVRYRLDIDDTGDHDTFLIRLKGDGKDYQFRLKADADDYYSYITQFSSAKEWKVIEIPMASLYPSFRGRALDMPNFSGGQIEEVGFLIGNNRNEDFELEIDWIKMK